MIWVGAGGCSQGEIIMNDPLKRRYVKTPSLRPRDHFGPCPLSAGEIVSLIDLGWADNRIACYFGVEPAKVSGASRASWIH
jgi:hypothetical protein